MAMHTNHPVSAPPAAPVRETTGHLLLRAWCVFLVTVALVGEGLVRAVGAPITGAIVVVSTVVSLAIWASVRPPLLVSRLPWLAFAFVGWAVLSLAWSAWPAASVVTLSLLLSTTFHGLFVGTVLAWRDVVRVVASAAKWAVAISLLFELVVAVAVRHPVTSGDVVWSSGHLFDGGPLQGIAGDPDQLAAVMLVALIAFGVRYAARAPRRGLLLAWMVVAGFLFVRSESATGVVSALFVALVLGTVLVMRTARRPGERTRWYVLYAVVGLGGAALLWLWREPVSIALGRAADLAGRERVWSAVLTRADQHPFVGWGFSSPWLAGAPLVDGAMTDGGVAIAQAHNVWLDAFLQLGAVGVVLLALVFFAYLWRSWFFAVDRPRWDLRSDRPYSPLTLVPTLIGALLVVQGVVDSGPLVAWGWLFVVLFGAKIKQAPLVGVGPAEQSLSIERGELQRTGD